MGGFEGLLEFLTYLRKKKITFRLEQHRDDTIMVFFTLVGHRVEVDFFNDHIEFSYFKGDEGVESDEKVLFDLIEKNWD